MHISHSLLISFEVAEGGDAVVQNNNTCNCILGFLDHLSIPPSISSSADSLLNMCKQSFSFRPQPSCVNSVPLAYLPPLSCPRPYSSYPSIYHPISSHPIPSHSITPTRSQSPPFTHQRPAACSPFTGREWHWTRRTPSRTRIQKQLKPVIW